MSAPAFKEWQLITEALGSGSQIIILRKGGITEGRSGFQTKADRFWLFPTFFHAQREKTKPAAAQWIAPANVDGPETITLRYFADLVGTAFVSDWTTIAALDRFHFWTEAAVRDKFDWSQPPGLLVLTVRVHRLSTPLVLPLTPAMGGCKSWIDLPLDFAAHASTPVLDEQAFAKRRNALKL
ncbi:MAG TPA: DUF1802 family protein [Rariglobus sp.]|jgi:hypothetical protein|nr:DUF1802 family protein [Rariglobus sp.]